MHDALGTNMPLTNCCLQVHVEKKRMQHFLPNDQLKHPQNPLISGQHSGKEAKALGAFHQLPYCSFIPAMPIMVLRLVLDVLAKLLIWQNGRVSTLLLERITAGKNEKREFSMRMFRR